MTRHDEEKWWQASNIGTLIKESDVKNHIFVVLATSVAEVGRDHDYDWAVVEPSSMRSIIQLAGRVQRHRKQSPTFENIVLLDKNFKGLRGLSPCFLRPGYESKKRQFYSTELSKLLTEGEYQPISAIPRIKNTSPPFILTDDKPPKFKRFNELEHIVQHIRLFGNNNDQDCAQLWWQHDVTWCGEIQRIQPFRKSEPMEDYNLNQSYHQEMIWQKKNTDIRPAKFEHTNDITSLGPEHLSIASGNQAWFDLTIEASIAYLMKKLSISEDNAYTRFTTVQLRKPREGEAANWSFHEKLGVFKELLKDRLNDDR